jgi:hypothetical protein
MVAVEHRPSRTSILALRALQKQFCLGKEKVFPMLADHTGLEGDLLRGLADIL